MKTKTFYIESKDSGLEYRIVWYRNGNYNCLAIHAYGPQWSKEYTQGILYFMTEQDGETRFHRGDVLDRYPISDDLAAMHVLIETFNRKGGDVRWYSKYRILGVQSNEWRAGK